MDRLFATTARGLEELLLRELESLGVEESKLAAGGVYFSVDERLLYQSLLWSRLASRILLPLAQFPVASDSDLYRGALAINWPALFSVDNTFAVYFSGLNDVIRNSQYGAVKIKDAIVDRFTREQGARPVVNRQQADIRIVVYLQHQIVQVALDLSGESLHQRGYRTHSGGAPLKENLAAAIVLRSGWQQGTPLIDPLCGSGTLLIEAAMMAADYAPGLQRSRWGFTAWRGFNPPLWQSLLQEAKARATLGLASAAPLFFGSDCSQQVIMQAQANAARAGVDKLIDFTCANVSQRQNPVPDGPPGTVISNPPYGERLESEPALVALYTCIGQLMKRTFPGWQLSLFSASPLLLSCLQLQAARTFKANNGPLECVQKNYTVRLSVPRPIAEDYANRLRKNCRHLEKWAAQEGVDCYRLYDADLPEYNVAIDRYGDKVVVQEYAPPKSVDPHKARQRLFTVIDTTLLVLGLTPEQLVLKTRARQRGTVQYQKLAAQDEFLLMHEYNAKLWVNLTDYLDSGLFLDHRLARRLLGQMSTGKDFLNLFAYTGTASVHAGLGGARSTTTVDMSRTYLAWAERNLRSNGLVGRQHRLIEANCLTWLTEAALGEAQFDLIFIDPPTFSNSKRMATSFEVQRDHPQLLQALKTLLRPQGIIMFSNNKHGFKLDTTAVAAAGLIAHDITAQTQSKDFARHRHMHNCWLLKHTGDEEKNNYGIN